MEMENRVIKFTEDKVKKTKKNLLNLIEDVEDSIPEVAEEVAQMECFKLKKVLEERRPANKN